MALLPCRVGRDILPHGAVGNDSLGPVNWHSISEGGNSYPRAVRQAAATTIFGRQ
jgi:hypothetical protein